MTEAIADEVELLRRLSDRGPSMLVTDQVTGMQRPTSGAFRPDKDGLSVYRHDRLADNKLTVADVIRHPQNVVAALAAGEIRAMEDLAIVDDPYPNAGTPDDHPRDVAHALVVGWATLSKNQRIRKQKAMSTLARLIFP